MTLDQGAIGREVESFERSWTDLDTLLYAVGVGAGQTGNRSELRFVTENSQGLPQSVLPTFPVVFLQGPPPGIGYYDPTLRLHASQKVTVHRPIPGSGSARCVTTVTGMWDKGKDALVETETVVSDLISREVMATLNLGLFLRGAGGFGGARGSSVPWELPDRSPDSVVSYETRREQALIYRLSGDRNPLHSDPMAADAGGFSQPILHGLCTFGFTGRALLEAACDYDVSRFGSMEVRFTRPVTPGEVLRVQMWTEPFGARFRTLNEAGETVLDRGVFTANGA